jgi:CubicO group peptidase (beta-lactamase class C family)
MNDGEIVYKQGYGLADLEHDVPIRPSTVFNIGSTSKQFTAFAIALLEDEGKLSLDDDMRRYLPEMRDFGRTITIRHLIHHTSGLRGTYPELLALAEWRQSDLTTTDDVCKLLRAQRELNFQPGDEFQYVNANYVLLAQICERISGQPFGAFCQERIFEPLGMRNSVINDFHMKLIPGRARSYYEDGQGGWLNAVSADSTAGPTNVYTTVEDLVRWDENFYTGQVGGQAVIERVHQPGRLNDGTELDYAFGLEVGPEHQHRGWQVVEHGGEHGGHSSWMVRFPELHLSVVVLFNHFLWEMREYAIKVTDLFLQGKATTRQVSCGEAAVPPQSKTPIESSADELEAKVGTYFNAQRAALRQVAHVEGRLQYEGFDLVPLGKNRFFIEKEPQVSVEFRLTAEGVTTGVKTVTPSGEYEYARVETDAPSPESLARYAGRYYSPELDICWTIEPREDHLVAKRRKHVDTRLKPVFTDAFSDDWLPIMGYPTTYLVVFERDARETISGLRVSGTRVRNLRFSRLDQ